MNKKDIEDLIAIMDQSNLSEIEVSDGNTKIVLRKNVTAAPTQILPPQMQTYTFPAQLQNSNAENLNIVQEEISKNSSNNKNVYIIKSPMVGTFYSSSSPDSDPFVQVGSNIENDAPVCILEAMKVMNEIQSEVSGKICEILAKNGQPVEFGQPLFKVEIS